MKFFPVAVFGAITVLTTTASAQDVAKWTGAAATITEGIGQSLGEAMNGGASVFVTATGRVRIPTRAAEVEVIVIEGKAPSAMEAARLREQHLETFQILAHRFGVTLDVGQSQFSHVGGSMIAAGRDEANAAASIARRPPPPPLMIPNAAQPAAPDAQSEFIARTDVRFGSSDPRRLASFLDALKGAGVEMAFVQNGTIGFPNFLARNNEFLSFGAVENIDDSVWDQASARAVAEARRQATVLAAAAGRQVGDAKQILLLSRSSQGAEASVTVAARFAFAFAPPK